MLPSRGHADLLTQSVAVRTKTVCLGDGGAAGGVQLDDLVHQGKLGVLKFLSDVFFDAVRILPDKFNVKHGFSPHI